jgi:uncharacterized protein YoxC
MVTTLLVVVAVLTAVTLIVLIVGLLAYMRRLSDAVSEIQHTLAAVRENMVPLAQDSRRLIADADEFVIAAREQVGRIRRLVDTVEQLLEGRTLTRAASAAVSSSKTTLVSVLEGIKQGIHALRRSKDEETAEPSPDESEAI